MARNIEVLRNYFLGKDPQLKEKMADNSLRLIGIPGRHFVLRTELIQRLKELKDYVDEQDQGLQDAIDTLADTLENEINRLENKYNITEDTRLYELDNGVYRVITPEIRLYFKQNGSMINDDDLILIKEAKSYFIFSTVPSTDHPAMTYGIADANDGWRATLMFEEIEQTTNKTNTVSSSSTSDEYPSALAVYNALQNYYTKGEVDQLISVIPQFDIEVVQTLPVQDISETTIYLVPSQDPQTANSYDEFIHVNNAWEQIGSTAIDLSDYYTKTEVDGMIPTQTSQLTNNGDGVTNPFVNKYAKTNMPNGGIYLEVGDQAFLVSNGQILANRLLDTRDIATMEVNTNKVTSISSSSTDTQYPSAKCVYDAIQNAGGITHLTTDSNIWQLDEGVYMPPLNGYLYYDPNDNTKRINIIYEGLLVIDKSVADVVKYALYMGKRIATGTIDMLMGISTIEAVQCQTTGNLVTSISSSSTDTQYPSAKCVYDALQNAGGPTITYGTTALTPGVSPLAEGTFYFQFE